MWPLGLILGGNTAQAGLYSCEPPLGLILLRAEMPLMQRNRVFLPPTQVNFVTQIGIGQQTFFHNFFHRMLLAVETNC